MAVISSGEFHPAERVRRWSAALASLLTASDPSQDAGRTLRFEPNGGSFTGRIDYLEFADLRLSRLSTSGQRVTMQEALAFGRAECLVIIQSKGVCTFEVQGQSLRLEPGHWAVMHPACPFVASNDRPMEQVILSGLPHGIEHALEGGSTGVWRFRGDTAVQRLFRCVVENLLTEPLRCSPGACLVLSRTLVRLLEQALEEHDEPEVYDDGGLTRARILEYIEAHLREPDLSLESIAHAFGRSKRTIHRTFDGRSGGESLNRYLWRRRVERCAMELRISGSANRRQTVTQVAYSYGFSSSAHFSRLFKQYLGTSPLRYKQGR